MGKLLPGRWPNQTKFNPPGGGSGMEARVARLEGSMEQIKVDIASIKAQIPHLATKAEISNVKSSIIQWLVGTMLASAALAAAIAFGLAQFLTLPKG